MLAGVLLFLPATGAAAAGWVHYRGRTSRGGAVRLAAHPPERKISGGITWSVRCSEGRLHTTTPFVQPFDSTHPPAFAASGSAVHRDPHGVRIRYTVAIRGHKAGRRTWRGTFRTRAVVRRNGRRIARCHLGRIRWHARRS